MAKKQRSTGRFAPEMQLACRALAHPIRLAVVELVEERPRRFGELVRGTGKQPGTLSPHLRHLQKGGILSKELRGEKAEVHEEYALSRFGERVMLAWDQAFGIPSAHTIRVLVGSAGSETMEEEAVSERSSIGHTLRIPLEM